MKDVIGTYVTAVKFDVPLPSASPVKVSTPVPPLLGDTIPLNATVTILVAPDVERGDDPSISSSFAIGTAVPLFVTNEVGISGELLIALMTCI